MNHVSHYLHFRQNLCSLCVFRSLICVMPVGKMSFVEGDVGSNIGASLRFPLSPPRLAYKLGL